MPSRRIARAFFIGVLAGLLLTQIKIGVDTYRSSIQIQFEEELAISPLLLKGTKAKAQEEINEADSKKYKATKYHGSRETKVTTNFTEDVQDNIDSRNPEKGKAFPPAKMTMPLTVHGPPFPDTRLSESDPSDPSKIIDFEHQPGGVIVTKVHGNRQWPMLEQTLCLLYHAYNHRPLYDILIFTTVPVTDEEIEHMKKVAHPVKLTVAMEANWTLQERIESFPPDQKQALMKRCNTSKVEDFNWFTRCEELGRSYERLMYTWQAEFRSKYIWHHPALQPYKWMMWMDTDAFATQVWEQDPIATAVRNNLAILFANFPAGSSRGGTYYEKFQTAFGQSLCGVNLKDGHLVATTGDRCSKQSAKRPVISQIHGFHHVTNLDFYRSPRVTHWSNTLIGNDTFSRLYDDQIAVTAPAAVYEPERSWDMYSKGIQLNVYHNSNLDGKRHRRAGGFLKYWKDHGKEQFPQAHSKCKIVAAN